MFHRTTRLFLRPAWPEDWEAVLGGIADEGVVRNLARAPWPYGPEDARLFTSRGQDPRYPSFLIVRPDTGQTIGGVGLGEDQGGIELGYWLARSAWGRGFATEAASGAIEIARLLGYRVLNAGHFVDNPASGRVLRKLGFAPTGHTRPRYCCARRCDVPAVEYSLDLADRSPQMQAA